MIVGYIRYEISSIGVGRTGDRCKPSVEKYKILRDGSKNMNLVIGIIVKNFSNSGFIQSFINNRLFGNESMYIFNLNF